MLPDAHKIAKNIRVITPPAHHAAVCAPPGVTVTPLEDDPLDGNRNPVMYLDDIVLSEACARGNQERLLVATKSAVSDHIRMLGRSQDNPVPIMSTAKLTNWMVAQEVLGFVIDTQSMRISVPVRKIDDIRAMLKEWPLNRTYARTKEVAS